ncbi:pyrrolo-quinoline quinone, partial [bacterium]|nr:pyrrolo-quinoline quinone [bacterium]
MVRLLAWIGIVVTAMNAIGDDWPQWGGPRRDGVWRETGIVNELPKELTFKWRTPVGQGYAGPCVVGERVYVMDRLLPKGVENPADPFDKSVTTGQERVLCLDRQTGKIL